MPDGSTMAGHNGPPLTEEEKDALATKFALDIIRDERVVAQKKADLDAARAKVNGHFKLIARELGITRKDFARDVIEVMGRSEAEYLSAEKRRRRLHQMAGVAVGEQLDLVDRIADTVDDAIAAESDGYRAGRRADDPIPPDHIASMFVTDWQRGWTRGQEVNAKAEALAAEVLARAKPGEMAADPDEEEGEEDDDPDAIIAEGAKRLKDSGWTEPTADEQQFEEAAA
jgi:hypothetical protein